MRMIARDEEGANVRDLALFRDCSAILSSQAFLCDDEAPRLGRVYGGGVMSRNMANNVKVKRPAVQPSPS